MTERNGTNIPLVVACIVSGLGIVATLAIGAQALYYASIEHENEKKNVEWVSPELTSLVASQSAQITADYSVLERDADNRPKRFHIPIDDAMKIVVNQAKKGR